MIGKLRGIVDSHGEDWVIVDVGGVGYHVSCSRHTLSGLPALGEVVSLSIETYVREDQIRLFGFSSGQERDWFRLLLGVQGVGTKAALGLLSVLTPDDLAAAVALEDKKALIQAQGVGPKAAGRIIGELKDKIPAGARLAGVTALPGAVAREAGPVQDAVSALVHLGYDQPQAARAVAAVGRRLDEEGLSDEGRESAVSAELLIRHGLRELAQ